MYKRQIINCGESNIVDNAIQSGKLSPSQIIELIDHGTEESYENAVRNEELCKKLPVHSIVNNGLIYENVETYTEDDFSLLAASSASCLASSSLSYCLSLDLLAESSLA